jgi:hypothetical protein
VKGQRSRHVNGIGSAQGVNQRQSTCFAFVDFEDDDVILKLIEPFDERIAGRLVGLPFTMCVHRTMAIKYSGPCRSRIPEDVDHGFRLKPIGNGR